ncbi:MAG: S8 family serine peptidase [Sphingobacteriales bacterium]|nr:S8 family serine peptidase [Sphingobacteriales bacterium]
MKRFFTIITVLICSLFVTVSLSAQKIQDYRILLHAGEFLPEKNIEAITKNAPVLQNSLFGEKHYVTIQFNTLPDDQTKGLLKSSGIVLIDYIPNNAYTAAIAKNINTDVLKTFSIRSIFQFTPEQKATPEVLNKIIPPYAIPATDFVDVTVLTYEKLTTQAIAASLQAVEAIVIEEMPAMFRTFTIRVHQSNLNILVALPFVQWVEFVEGPKQNDNLPGRSLHRVNVIGDGTRNLKGDGINIGVWDAGEISPHMDFLPASRLTQVESSSPQQHSTHVAGTILGRGLLNPFARGMAPNANLFSWNYNGDVQAEMAVGIPANNLIASSHSYNDGGSVSCNINGIQIQYTLRSRNTDINLNNFAYHLHAHSSGNAGTTCSGQYMTITGTGKSAKNNVVVGNISSLEGLASSSSCGPVQDGRIKPELVAMGTSVFSTSTPLNTYATLSGTSMSTPGIAGSLSLLVQRYKQLNSNNIPPSTLIKNAACNSAQDLGNPGPDYRFGFGRINALAAVKILEENRYLLGPALTTSGVSNTNITVPAGAARLRVMLTWNDPAAAANANPALVNDLDLTVVNGATTTLPWILDKNNPSFNATQAVDNISNIEQVTIDNPPAGSYTLTVNGTSIPSGPQTFALTWIIDQPYIEVTYPNGPESFNPGSQEVITWDNAGITGTQNIEYSLDNGATWTLISSAPPATTRLTWTVPAANTSTAKVRVSSGAVTDMSDAPFKILGTVTGFANAGGTSCSAGEVNLTWTAVTNATHYDIYRLDLATGAFVIQGSNITGTTYTATGLAASTSYWFTIVAKNNSVGSVSERAIAINVTSSAGGGGLGAVGAITGQTNICGTPNGVPYSISPVSGATSYTWTAPPGATIASGQGTTNITINYLAGSSSGNVSVFASNGTCQTAPATLAINVGGANIPAPLSGGNQSATVCPGNPIPTLTATATVPPGFTVVWYDAPTGGNVVVNPILNTAGTITYYAASRDNITLCESTNRTAVTLTITQVPVASISAGGPTTFCQGSSVTLTANAGTSYSWSNGATSQSITVSTAGTYSVTVTTGSCVSTSPATTVVVNPAPTASISAGGPTTFCQGLSVVLTASAGSSWSWSNGATTQSITVTTSGNYTVTVTNSFGCSTTSAATTVTVNPNPPAVVSASGPVTFCQGGSVTLTANAGNAYLWSNGATTQSITVNGPIGSTNYSVQVTQAGGCVSISPNTAVTVNPIPAANISAGGPLAFCQGSNVVLTASAGSSWLWSNGATTQSITVTNSGSYSVTVTNSSGCSNSSSSTVVAVSPNPVVTISASPYSSLFPGLTTTLTANVTPPGTYNYAWYKNGVLIAGAISSTITGINLSGIGNYTVTVTNTTGLPCSNTSQIMAIRDSATTKLFIFPSPNAGQFNVAYYTPGTNVKNTLTIFDSKGARVYTKVYTINSPYQNMDVDLRRFGHGIYQVVLYDASGRKLANGQVLTQ